MRSGVIIMLAVCLSVAFAETQRSSMHMQYSQDEYCTRSVLRETSTLSELLCAGQCKRNAQCVAYSRRGSQCVLHDGFCSSSDLLSEAGARYAEMHWDCYGSSCYYMRIFGTLRNKASAQAECEKFGAHVVAIETVEENALILKLTGHYNIWLRLEKKGDSWENDGEPTTYFNWESSQPNGDGTCAFRDAIGEWWDRGCSGTHYVLCEK